MKDTSLTVNVSGEQTTPKSGGMTTHMMDTGTEGMQGLNRFPSSKLKLDEFFLNWLSSQESQKLVMGLLEDAKAGRPLQAPMLPSTPTGMSPLSPSSTQALFSATTTPPLSPNKGPSPPRSPVSPAKRVSQGGPGPALKKRASDAIPRFYFSGGGGGFTAEASAAKMQQASKLFASHPRGMDQDAFRQVVREVCELPSFFAPLVMHRVHGSDVNGADAPKPVTEQQFAQYWRETLSKKSEQSAMAFEVLRQPQNPKHLVQADFRPILRCILDTHAGLEFLKDSPEFQDRYLETVTYRIFYSANPTWNGKMTLRELRRSDLMQAMQHVDEEEDINKVLRYFSYEHFYVVYCKFWELDGDHDFLIDKEDLLRYGNHALTYRVVDRIFAEMPRRFVSGVKGKMGYEDFVWFILSEEDKANGLALEYWFRCIDLDGNGELVPSEMEFFYEEQLQRMECLSQEPVLFADILCQMTDMLKPDVEGRIRVSDLKRNKLAGNFFNVLFNLNKFIQFETRDPFLIRQEREEPHLTEWDRFARAEYIRLSMEEEEGAVDGSGDIWDDNMDAPF